MDVQEKYPPVELTSDFAEKLAAMPQQAWWADEDEPCIHVPSGLGAVPLPYRVALQYGVVRLKE